MRTNTNSLKRDSNTTELDDVRMMMENFSSLMSSHQLSIKTFSNEALQRMNNLDPQTLRNISQNFGAYHTVCEKISEENIRLRDNIAFVKCGLKHLKLMAPSVFFDVVAVDDLVEIYDLNNIQIFRNLRFFEITNYSLADLLTFSWHELYERSSIIMDKMAEGAKTILAGDELIAPLNVPVHLIKEIRTNPIQVCQVKFKFISPVYDLNGQKAGVIVNCQAKSLVDAVSANSVNFI